MSWGVTGAGSGRQTLQAPERAQCRMEQNSEPEQSSSLCRSTLAPTEGCGPGALSPFLLLRLVNGREAAR